MATNCTWLYFIMNLFMLKNVQFGNKLLLLLVCQSLRDLNSCVSACNSFDICVCFAFNPQLFTQAFCQLDQLLCFNLSTSVAVMSPLITSSVLNLAMSHLCNNICSGEFPINMHYGEYLPQSYFVCEFENNWHNVKGKLNSSLLKIILES